MVRGDFGAVADFTGWSSKDGAFANLEPFVELGYEYGHVFNENFYVSAGLSWTVTYPRNFQPANGFFEPPIALWYTPLTYLQAGYVFNNNLLFTGGLVYFWGLMVTARFPISDHLFFETKSLLWLDRLFDTRGFFGKGFDNFSSSLGVGYHF